MRRTPLVALLAIALVLGAFAPAVAHPRGGHHGGGPGHGATRHLEASTVIEARDDSGEVCATLSALAHRRTGMTRLMQVANDCEDAPWFVTHVVACMRDGSRTEPRRIVTEGDAELGWRDLRRLGFANAVDFGTVPGDTWVSPEFPDFVDRDPRGYYLVDVDGRAHDRLGDVVHPRMDREHLLSGDLDGRHFLARTHPRTGVIKEFVFDNSPEERVGHYLFEVRFRNGTYSRLFFVQTPPHSVVTMGRDTLRQLGIRNAVGVGQRLMEVGDDGFTDGNATIFDEDGNVVRLQDVTVPRGSCWPGVT